MINELNIKIFDFIFKAKDDAGFESSKYHNKFVAEMFDNNVHKCIEFLRDNLDLFENNKVLVSQTTSGYGLVCNEFARLNRNGREQYLQFKYQQILEIGNSSYSAFSTSLEKWGANLNADACLEILCYAKSKGIIVFTSKGEFPIDITGGIMFNKVKFVGEIDRKLNFDTSKMNPLNITNNFNKNGAVAYSHSGDSTINEAKDDELFSLVIEKLSAMNQEGVDKETLERLEESCKGKKRNAVVDILKDIVANVGGSIIATVLLAKFGIQ